MKTKLLAILLFISALCSAQEITLTQDEAQAYLEAQQESHISTIPEYSVKYSLFDIAKPGEIVINGREIYKVVEFTEVMSHNVGYIFLDTKKLSKPELEALTKTILDQYAEGTPFDMLAQDYTMDGNPNSAMLKYTDGEMVETFEKAVLNHKKGEIFTVETTDEGWFHIVKKNENDREVKAIKAEYAYFQE